MLYHQLIESHLEEGHMALTLGGQCYSYRDLNVSSRLVLSALQEYGISSGDRILISSGNDLETVILILACIAGGIIIIPISDKIGFEQYRRIVENCKPTKE